MKIVKIIDIAYLPEIQKITKQAYGYLPWTEEQYLADFKLNHTFYYGLFKENYLVGYAHLQQIGLELELLNFAIVPEFQNLGLGQKLLAASLNRLKCTSCFLEVRKSNLQAQKVYSNLGFKLISERKDYYHCPKENALIMEWKEEKNALEE